MAFYTGRPTGRNITSDIARLASQMAQGGTGTTLSAVPQTSGAVDTSSLPSTSPAAFDTQAVSAPVQQVAPVQQAPSYSFTPQQLNDYMEQILTTTGAPAWKGVSEQDWYSGNYPWQTISGEVTPYRAPLFTGWNNPDGLDYVPYETVKSQSSSPQNQKNQYGYYAEVNPWTGMETGRNVSEYSKFLDSYNAYNAAGAGQVGDTWTRFINNYGTDGRNFYNRFGVPDTAEQPIWSKIVLPWVTSQNRGYSDIGNMGSVYDANKRWMDMTRRSDTENTFETGWMPYIAGGIKTIAEALLTIPPFTPIGAAMIAADTAAYSGASGGGLGESLGKGALGGALAYGGAALGTLASGAGEAGTMAQEMSHIGQAMNTIQGSGSLIGSAGSSALTFGSPEYLAAAQQLGFSPEMAMDLGTQLPLGGETLGNLSVNADYGQLAEAAKNTISDSATEYFNKFTNPDYLKNQAMQKLYNSLGSELKDYIFPAKDTLSKGYLDAAMRAYARQQQMQRNSESGIDKSSTGVMDTGSQAANAALMEQFDPNSYYSPTLSAEATGGTFDNRLAEIYAAYQQAMRQQPEYGVSKNITQGRDFRSLLREMGV